MKKPVIFILVILFNVFTTNAQIPIVSGSGSEILHDSTYIFQWNYNTQFWDTMIREVLDYDFRGNITRQLIQRRDTIKDVWNNEEKTVWNYDMTGILTEILTPYWDSNSGAWLNSYRQLYKLLNDGLVKEEVGQTWNSDENAWDNDYKFTRTYDFQGNLIELLSQYGSSDNDSWLNYAKNVYTYNADFSQMVLIYHRWSSSEWFAIDKYIHYYNEHGKMTELLYQVWGINWGNVCRYTYLFDDNDKLLEYRYQGWDDLHTIWTDQYRIIHTYDGTGNPTGSLHQTAPGINDLWTNLRKDSCLYDERGYKMEATTDYWENKWVKTYKTIYEYDEFGNITDSIDQGWNVYSQEWLNNCWATLYYSEHPVAIETFDNTSDRKMMVFPNPLKETGTFMYPSGQTIRIDIYNESGMLIETLQDMDKDGTSQMRFTEYPPGFYFYHLVNSEGICYSGKLIRE